MNDTTCAVVAQLISGLSALSAYPQWVAWRKEPLPNGKTKKLLINPHTGYPASSTNETTWGTAEQVQEFCTRNTDHYIGFVFTESDPFFFVDIDNAYDGTDWNDWSKYLLSCFPEAFVETSQSGRGLHIIGIGSKAADMGCKSDHDWDIYTEGRFVALTGTYPSGDAGKYDHTAMCQQLSLEYLKPEHNVTGAWTTEPIEGYNAQLTDDELIAKAMKSGEDLKRVYTGEAGKALFKDLWNRDLDVLEQCYPNDQGDGIDWSRVDSAACTHLAYWVGKDCERIERMMTESPLCRDKWENRPKYRESTIIKACSVCKETYQTTSAATLDFAKQLQVTGPLETSTTQPKWTEGVTPGGHYSKQHTPNAIEFLTAYYSGGKQLVSISKNEYHRFNGKVWEVVKKEQLEHEVATSMIAIEPQNDWIEGTFKVATKLVSNGTLKLGQWAGRDTSQLVTYNNGILDLSTMAFEPHNPNFFTTNILPYDFDPDAVCPTWQSFLEATMEGDMESVALLQEWFGYQLVRDYRHQKAMFMIGAPRSGKGTIGRILKALVGGFNLGAATLEGLADDETLESISDKPSVLMADEQSEIRRAAMSKAVGNFKKVTGRDTMTFKRKYISNFQGELPCRFTIIANALPMLFDDSGAFSARMLLLVFNKSWVGKEDHTLGDKLENEIQGIANWAIEGLLRLQANGRFTEPNKSTEERDEINDTLMPLKSFVKQRCVLATGERVHTATLYAAYVMWCATEGVTAWKQRLFIRKMRETYRCEVKKGTTYVDGHIKQGFMGLGLQPIADPSSNVVPLPVAK